MQQGSIRAALATLGCKVNQYDSQAMQELLQKDGFTIVDFHEPADVYLINTCTVTQTSDKKSRQLFSRAHAQNPDALIVAAGCYAQRTPQDVLAMAGVDLVIGNAQRQQITELIRRALEEKEPCNAVHDIQRERVFEPLSAIHGEKTRAHLKIQEGCDRYCSYCIVPYVRGPVRSRPPQDVKTELIELARAGYREVVLTGIHLMSYGKDLGEGCNLLDAIRQGADVEGISRIRLGSLEPAMMNDAFVAGLAEQKKICRHFHLSLQSGSDSVLSRMNRRYSAAEFADAVRRLRAAMPGCAITTDIIAGFPGETEQEHQETLAFVKEISFARMHVFPFSSRAGTKAAAMPGQLPKAVKEERAHQIADLARQQEEQFVASIVGSVQTVVPEIRTDKGWEGYTDTYVRILLDTREELSGPVQVQITEAKGDMAIGRILSL